MFWSLITVSFSASNYIISGSSGFETAKACAVIEETPRSNENQISIDDNYDLPVSVKPGEDLLNDLDFIVFPAYFLHLFPSWFWCFLFF